MTWDVNKLLHYLNHLSPPKALNLATLSRKLVTLLVLLSGQRGQSIYLLNVKDVECANNQLTLRFSSPLKQSRPGNHLDEITIPGYHEPGLCVVTTYLEYTKRTKSLRHTDCTKLFVTSTKPHNAIARDTLSNWVKRMLRQAGVDMSHFTPHSTRAASTSAAFAANIPLCTIVKTAGWTGDCMFRKHYNKTIQRDTSFASALLQKGAKK